MLDLCAIRSSKPMQRYHTDTTSVTSPSASTIKWCPQMKSYLCVQYDCAPITISETAMNVTIKMPENTKPTRNRPPTDKSGCAIAPNSRRKAITHTKRLVWTKKYPIKACFEMRRHIRRSAVGPNQASPRIPTTKNQGTCTRSSSVRLGPPDAPNCANTSELTALPITPTPSAALKGVNFKRYLTFDSLSSHDFMPKIRWTNELDCKEFDLNLIR